MINYPESQRNLFPKIQSLGFKEYERVGGEEDRHQEMGLIIYCQTDLPILPHQSTAWPVKASAARTACSARTLNPISV